MIVQIEYKGLNGNQSVIHDIDCSDTEVCEISGHPMPTNEHKKWYVVFDNIDQLPMYEIVQE